MLTGDGTLLLYDNGNHRTSPFDGQTPLLDSESFSRAVEYEIDDVAMTVEQVWEYGENITDTLFTPFIGDADWQPTSGNVVITYGAVSFVGGVPSADLGFGAIHTRIIEVTDDIVPTIVFDLAMYDGADPTNRISTFRSERIPSLYASAQLFAPNGVGDTLVADKILGESTFSWAVPAVDGTHTAAEYYVVYQSDSPDAGFAMMDTSVDASADTAGTAVYYKIVAANEAGTSGDEPAP